MTADHHQRGAARPRLRFARSHSTEEKLLSVAGRMFAERGYYAVTVREICALAGTNVAAVNYHFGDKLGLYTAVLQRAVRASHVEAVRDALDQNAEPEQLLRAAIRARLEGVWRSGPADLPVRILMHELNRPTPALKRLAREITLPIYQRMLEVIGKILGLPPGHETTRLCAHSIMGQIMLYVLAAPLFGTLFSEIKMMPAQTERIADHIADFSMAYLRAVRRQNKKTRRTWAGRGK